MSNVIKINKGVIAFYIIIALVALLCVMRMNNLNVVSSNTNNINESYCA